MTTYECKNFNTNNGNPAYTISQLECDTLFNSKLPNGFSNYLHPIPNGVSYFD